SIGDAVKSLRDRQRNWACYAPDHRGRAELIAQRLPHVSAKPLLLGAPAPTAPLGSWTLLAPDLLLASMRCSSPFPNGEPPLVERWQQSKRVRNFVVTVKFQGDTDHDIARAFADLPGSRVFHLHHNRHELTFAALEDPHQA